ncbi:hypothetical protein [Desertivirga arenae]|uniref:hypothetical protein n=1 Tax=Desertivirga arenae TaxID=2810309 RepID=UPI001A95AC9B|nr:hypothetical protein [Pedobacter sp. SYSU D00823]
MITHKLNSKTELEVVREQALELNLLEKFNAFADRQKPYQMVWWLLTLMVIGGLALPLTFLLVYSYNGPVIPFLTISMISFFACIVSNMGGMGIRVNIGAFWFSLILHVLMVSFTILF